MLAEKEHEIVRQMIYWAKSLDTSISRLLEALMSLCCSIKGKETHYLIVQVQLPVTVVLVETRVETKNIEKRFIIIKGLNESLDIILSLQNLSSFIYGHSCISHELEQISTWRIRSEKTERSLL